MQSLVRPELPTASVVRRKRRPPPWTTLHLETRPESTYKSGKTVQTNGATSLYWQIKDDRTGKQKLSKDIHIHITETGIEDYAGETSSGKLKTEKQLAAYIRKKLLHFDPSHNAPPGATIPCEEWSFGNA